MRVDAGEAAVVQLVAHGQGQLQIQPVRVGVTHRRADARQVVDGRGPVSAQRTAVDSGPCADGRTGCVGIDVRVTPVTTRFGSRLIEAGHSAGRRNVMSATVPVALVRSSMAWLSAFISGNPARC